MEPSESRAASDVVPEGLTGGTAVVRCGTAAAVVVVMSWVIVVTNSRCRAAGSPAR